MQLITKEEFAELINYRGDYAISIFLPTHRSGVEVNEKQDAISLKNALQALEIDLRNQGVPIKVIETLLCPGYELYKNDVFWNNQLDSLAIFMAGNFFKVFQLPFTVNEEVYINDDFLLSPLLPAITNSEEFYLLVLSKHDAKFYQGNAYGLQKLEIKGLPDGMDDVVHFEEKEGQQLFRQGGKGGTGSANFHGHSPGQLEEKDNLALYFREVDKTLFTEILHDKNDPLLLAGVEYLIPIYNNVSKYNFIATEAITGSQEHENQNVLFEKARTLLAPFFKQRTNKALQNYYNQIAKPLTSSMPETVIPASYYAQVSDLFVSKGEHIWGKFNEVENKLEIHANKQPGDECLLNQAAINTINNGGRIYLLDKENMPKESVIAASLRF